MSELLIRNLSECKKCGNKYSLPMMFSKNEIEYFAPPKICECGNTKFKTSVVVMDKSNLKPTKNHLITKKSIPKHTKVIHKFCECKNCGNCYYFPMILENGKLLTAGFICACGKHDYKVLKLKQQELKVKWNIPKEPMIMVK
jgi:hypothetical protein